jgi:hypothetical protein
MSFDSVSSFSTLSRSDSSQGAFLGPSPASEAVDTIKFNRRNVPGTVSDVVQDVASLALDQVQKKPPTQIKRSPGIDLSVFQQSSSSSAAPVVAASAILKPLPSPDRKLSLSTGSAHVLPHTRPAPRSFDPTATVTWTVDVYERQGFQNVTPQCIALMSPHERAALYKRLTMIADTPTICQKRTELKSFLDAERDRHVLDRIVTNEDNFQELLLRGSFLLFTHDELLKALCLDIQKSSTDETRCGAVTQFSLKWIARNPDLEQAQFAFTKLNQAHAAPGKALVSSSSSTNPCVTITRAASTPAFDVFQLASRMGTKDKKVSDELIELQRTFSTKVTEQDLCSLITTPSQTVLSCISLNTSLTNALCTNFSTVKNKTDWVERLITLSEHHFDTQDFATSFCILQALQDPRITGTVQAVAKKYKSKFDKLTAKYPTYWLFLNAKKPVIHSLQALQQEVQSIAQMPSFIMEQNMACNLQKLQRFYLIAKMFA